VGGVDGHGIDVPVAAAHFRAVAAVLGCKDAAAPEMIVVAVRVAEVVAAAHAEELLGGEFGVGGGIEVLRRDDVEHVAPVLDHEEDVGVAVPVQCDGVADARGVALAVRLRLRDAGKVEAPDARLPLELGTRVLSRRARLAVRRPGTRSMARRRSRTAGRHCRT
jgi:hypothetical protein